MFFPKSNSKTRALALLSIAGLLTVVGCSHQSTRHSATTQPIASAVQSGQQSFDSADAAASALKEAVEEKDRHALVTILGDEGRQLVFTGDRVEEQNNMAAFATHLGEYLRVDQEAADRAVMYVGNNNWPFPIPIVKGSSGWYFDTAAGKEELLNRVIGENELSAISVCRAYVAAQREYMRKDRDGDGIAQYAQHFMSSAGKHDGLYWQASGDDELSPMGPLVAQAQMEGYLTQPPNGQRHPYKGYFFHILTAQGDAAPGGKMSYIADGRLIKGFAMIAWPDKWGSSGVMTFIVNQDGKIYQKNLGDQTPDALKSITEYNPDSSWEAVKD